MTRFLPYTDAYTGKQRTTIKALKRHTSLTVKDIAAKLDLPYSTVWDITNEPMTPQRQRGRPPIVDTPLRCRIVNYVTASAEGRRADYTEVKAALGLPISISTIRRILDKEGFRRRMALSKPFLTSGHLNDRMIFALMVRHWRGEWRLVIFTDEAAFQNGGNVRRWVTRRKNERLHLDCLLPKYSKPSSIMAHGSINYYRKGPLTIADWVEILEERIVRGRKIQKKRYGRVNANTLCQYVMPVSVFRSP